MLLNKIRVTLSLLLICSSALQAENIELRTDKNLVITADFMAGENNANPVLILHGFLQTKEFPTVARLAASLHDSGHTVLAPTLSLDIGRRGKSLACEAIHTHDIDKDATEIRQWVSWLKQQTGKPVVLIGHSAGSLVLLNYLKQYGNEDIAHAVLISMKYFSEGPLAYETPKHAELAKNHLDRGIDPLNTYALSFCKTYPTTASAFLSYYDWDRQQVAIVAKKYASLITSVIGTNDKRISPDWREELSKNGIGVLTVEGANHFFDQAHEFDLLDIVEQVLSDISH
ncbi:MAG: alpha/beta hydrolase family protein [Chromatiales bacterium]|jgi:pimeloyl-ACP methyl ester carboxylesterase